jgi:hypothetical protein
VIMRGVYCCLQIQPCEDAGNLTPGPDIGHKSLAATKAASDSEIRFLRWPLIVGRREEEGRTLILAVDEMSFRTLK